MFQNNNKVQTACPPYVRKEPLCSLLSDYFVNGIKRRNGQSKIRISMLRLKLLLTLIKEKSLIHLDPITIWVPRTFYPFVNVGLNRLIDYALSMTYSKHIIEERTLLSNVIVKTGQVVTPWR